MLRAGVDSHDSYEQLCRFVRTVSQRSRVRHFVVHARKCLLHGLSPHEKPHHSPAQVRTMAPAGRMPCCMQCLLAHT